MSLKGMHLLVVDDDHYVRQTLKDTLELEDAKVTLAEDGNKAYELITAENDFDLVLSDIRMPNCSGIDLLNKIRDYKGDAPDIILISGFTDISVTEAKKMGAKGIFMKKEILNRLLEHVKSKKEEKTKKEEVKDDSFNILNFSIND